MEFVLNQAVEFEESLTCEFKEVKAQPVQTIGKRVDEYVVAFLNTSGGSIYWGIRDVDRVVTGVSVTYRIRDELRQVIGQKLSAIAPPVSPPMIEAPFHHVCDFEGRALDDTYVLEVRVSKPKGAGLFFTGTGAAYRRTIGGIQKLSGADLFIALAGPLQHKIQKPDATSLLARLPTVHRRAEVVQPIIQGRRVLWVDDKPSNNFYERRALAEMGLIVDVAMSSDEGQRAAGHLPPDVIVSDMERNGHPEAGTEFLHAVRAQGFRSPLIFYIGDVDESRGVPKGALAITERPDEVLHLIMDVLERGAI